jgi:hypothetical protein
MLRFLSLSALSVALFSIGVSAPAQDASPSVCKSYPSSNRKSSERADAVALMTVAKLVEGQGEKNFHVTYTNPRDECLVESFNATGANIVATYNPLEAGGSTLNFRFHVDRPDGDTEILVVNSGLAGLVAGKGKVIHVSEEKEGIISWYAMYREEPNYSDLKALVIAIAGGQAKPMMSVRWPSGAKEGEALAFDSKRLK